MDRIFKLVDNVKAFKDSDPNFEGYLIHDGMAGFQVFNPKDLPQFWLDALRSMAEESEEHNRMYLENNRRELRAVHNPQSRILDKTLGIHSYRRNKYTYKETPNS